MHGCGGHAWLPGGVHGCRGCLWLPGVCAWLPGGVCGCWGACVVAGGVCVVAAGAWIGYDEIRSMSGRYSSYWNAFLFIFASQL